MYQNSLFAVGKEGRPALPSASVQSTTAMLPTNTAWESYHGRKWLNVSFKHTTLASFTCM
jgi:hypothetical protein